MSDGTTRTLVSMQQERSVMITFGGWCVDLFETAKAGTLGMTVEKSPHTEAQNSADIFIREVDGGIDVSSTDALQNPGFKLREEAFRSLMESGVSVESAFELLLHALDKKLTERQTGISWQRCIDHVACLRGHFTEFGTTAEDDEKLSAWGFFD